MSTRQPTSTSPSQNKKVDHGIIALANWLVLIINLALFAIILDTADVTRIRLEGVLARLTSILILFVVGCIWTFFLFAGISSSLGAFDPTPDALSHSRASGGKQVDQASSEVMDKEA